VRRRGRTGGRLSLRGGKFGAFIACSNYPECAFPPEVRPAGRGRRGREREHGHRSRERACRSPAAPAASGRISSSARARTAKRASIPKDLPDFDFDWALRLLSLPREIGAHPETGNMITASIGRYGPYLAHDGKYAKLLDPRRVRDRDERRGHAARRGRQPQRRRRRARQGRADQDLGAHPTSGGEIKVMPGRYGPYVTDGATNCHAAEGPETRGRDRGAGDRLIDARAAKGPGEEEGRAQKAPAKRRQPSHERALRTPPPAVDFRGSRQAAHPRVEGQRPQGNRQGADPTEESTRDRAKIDGINIAKKR
jgi:DNA topoisomerase-1